MKKAKSEAVSIARYIGSFLNDYAPIHMTGSTHTLKSYETAISLYLTFLEEMKSVTGAILCWEHFSHQWIEDWIEWLKTERGCKPASCNVRLGSIRSFLKYVGEHDPGLLHVYQDSTTIKKCKIPSRKVEGLTKEAVKVLLEVPDLDTSTGRRDLALMVLLYSTAARISEILSLKIKDIHLDAKKPYITVIGKRDKIRTAYLLPKAASHVRQYILEFHGGSLNSDAYLFYSRCGGFYSMLTPPAIDKRLKKYASQAHEICPDVPIGLHPHQFRHAKASHWLEDGINIVQISFLLGHAQLQTTMIYLDISKDQELKALATLETENDKKVPPKWKDMNGSLKDLCGLGKRKA
jgi:site-specific recombinase XerD